MTTAVSGVDYKSAPSDYAELHRTYYKYVVNLVGSLGIDDNNKEDVASEILATFLARGFLEKFDPDLVFDYKGEKRPARFKSFLSRFVATYARGYYDKQKRLAGREIQICDMYLGHPSANERVTWVEVYGESSPSHEDDVLEILMEEEIYHGLRAYLGKVPRRSVSDSCDLVALFDAVRAQCLDKGKYDIAVLKDTFGVSSTAMHTWVWWLKENLAAALGQPVPAKRPRTTKPKS